MTKPLINDVKRSELANALALHDFANTTYDLKAWVAYVVELFRTYGLEPTRMGISATSIKYGKMKTYIREVKKLDTIDNATITGIEIQATRHGSDDSNWDDIFNAFLSIENSQSTCVISLDNEIVKFDRQIWNGITQNLSNFFNPRYGYGFQRTHKKGPVFYPLGIGCDLEYRSAESELINCWANAYRIPSGKYRTGDMRDIYPMNVLSAAHNERMVEDMPLFDWINADASRGTLTKLDDNLWSWWVPEAQIDAVRASLKPTGILLCAACNTI